MKYLSIDIEATGLDENCLILEFAMIPFCTNKMELKESLQRDYIIKSPSFDELKPTLDKWVIDHNKEMIDRSFASGITLETFKNELQNYFESDEVKAYFEIKDNYKKDKVIIFGKSLGAIDLPFLNRDLGWNFFRKYFKHRQLDLSAVGYSLVDMNFLPAGSDSGEKLMNYLGMGTVKHTALEDAKNTALMYFELIKRFRKN